MVGYEVCGVIVINRRCSVSALAVSGNFEGNADGLQVVVSESH